MGRYIDHHRLLEVALEEAKIGLSEGGLPVGAALFDERGILIGKGHSHRVQKNDPTAHAEVEAFRNAGQKQDFKAAILVTTVAPCWICRGLVRQFGIKTVIVGDSQNSSGTIQQLREDGVTVVELNSPDCILMLKDYILAFPEVWHDDAGEL